MRLDRLFLDAQQAADARADQRTDALGVRLPDLKAAVLQRHHRRGDAVMDELVHLLGVLWPDPAADVEVAHFAGDTHRVIAPVEFGQRFDPTLTGEKRLPG